MTISLAEKLSTAGSIKEMLRNAPVGFYQFPVPDEHTNWRDEQRAWYETAVLFDQSYHMTDVYLSGPDTVRLLAETSLNNYTDFPEMKAFQYVALSGTGHIIGDAIGFHERGGKVSLIGKPSAANYITYVAETGDYDVELVRDVRSLEGDGRRTLYRFQLQGPKAFDILEKAIGGPVPETRPFGMCAFKIEGCDVTALRHGMAGMPGLEFWGPYADRETVLGAVIAAGDAFGMKRGGGKTYSTSGPQSGWVGAVLPAVYTDPSLQAYREWLPAHAYEGSLSIGGSFDSDDLEDFYLDPWDVGYHRLIHWDHTFHGRDALIAKREQKHRKKVWLQWHPDDVQKIVGSMLSGGNSYKFLEWPAAHYATCPYDHVRSEGRNIGMSIYAAFTMHVGGWFSIGIIEEDEVTFGKEVSILWGEADGGSAKPTVEPHIQTDIRARITKTALGE